MNSPDPEVKCPYNDGEYQCGAPIAEREIKAVSIMALKHSMYFILSVWKTCCTLKESLDEFELVVQTCQVLGGFYRWA